MWARADGGHSSGYLHFLGRMDTAEVGYHQAKRGFGGGHYSILQPSCQTESPCRTQVRSEDPHDHSLAEAREMHWRALKAAHLLEQNIERLSQEASKVKFA